MDPAAERSVSPTDVLAELYPAQVIKPFSTAFTEAQNSYWNVLQRRKTPTCFFRPTDAQQVQTAIAQVARARWPFAIKGGGHSSNSEGSSIENGFVFDLVNLNHVEIAGDNQTVRVGPGVRWGPLFKTLEKKGVIAVGGRDFGVGVPGFTFGGGISYYSNQYGWGIDNLVSVDIVLANGDLITVDEKSHPDLNRALHGGGAHNFGIVTSLTLKLYPYKGMWGGVNVVVEEHFDKVFDAYDAYTRELVEDGKAHMIMDFFRKDGQILVAQFMGYPEPLENPPIFHGLRRIPNVTNTLRLADYSDLASEMAEATDSTGKRNAYWTLAVEYDIDLVRSIYELWARTTEPHTNRARFALDLNHITPAMRNRAARQGVPNVYGLEGPDWPLINILLTGVWDNEVDDEAVTAVLRDLGSAIEALAERRGKSLRFKYMNYANQEQDVIAGFGEKNAAFLKEIAGKYDPEGVFQELHVGAFKLGAGTPSMQPRQGGIPGRL